jgi:3-deoxy-7-phosphoheptulonate synthase
MSLNSPNHAVSTQDLRIKDTLSLRSPDEVQSLLPTSAETVRRVATARREIADCIHRRDDRLVAVVGPCSIHDPDAAIEYASHLATTARALADALCVVMRVYFEKPRTIVGWKGLINDPGLDGSCRINDGLLVARRLMLDVAEAGLPTANEFLDATIGQYFADLVAWGCIGARTVESQVHRQLASGLSMPVGFKNRTDGDVRVAVEAMQAAAHEHWFPSLARDGRPAILRTSGNPDTHVVLRGGSRSGPNHAAEHVAAAAAEMQRVGRLAAVMIDCSHANSGKDLVRQTAVAQDVATQVAAGERAIVGVMLESNLVAGRQDLVAGSDAARVRGQSVTDPCLGWGETKMLLETLAESVRRRRRG